MHQPRGPIDNWTSRAALQFPQLRRLSVRNASVDVKTVLGAFVRRKKGALRRLEIESTVALAPQLMSLDVGRYGAESVAVSCVGLGHLAPGKADRLARQVLHSASQSVSCLRVAIAAQLPVQLSDVSLHKFSQLRTLELRMPVPLAEVTSVVQQLPCLWRLKAPYIATAKLPINEMKSLDRFYALMTTCPPQKLIAPAIIERTLALEGLEKQHSLSRQELIDQYEVIRTAEVINAGPDGKNYYLRIALQFPDELLPASTLVSEELQSRLQDSQKQKVFILADTSYGSCCVDEVAADHYSADIVVHYGRTCLSLTTRTPVYYVFGHHPLDTKDCAQKAVQILEPGQNILLICDVPYVYAIEEIARELRTCGRGKLENIVLSEISVLDRLYVPTAEETNGNLRIRPGRSWKLGGNQTIADYTILYVGGESLTLTNIMVTERAQSVFSYDPRRSDVPLREESSKVNKHLNRRYYMVQRAKDANIVGIVVGTLAATRYLRVVEALKQMLRSAGRKYYVFIVGKLNVAKLANFAEIETFVLVACPENSLVDSKDFYQPVVTPYEMLLALSRSLEWTGDYVTDFHAFLEEARLHHHDEEEQSDDDLPHFSLITGTLKQNRRYNHPKDSNHPLANDDGLTSSSALVTRMSELEIRNKNTEIAEYMGSAGAEYLMNRSFRGLGHDGCVDENVEPMKAVEGLSGIARGYNHEKDA
ncbi:Diphthamide biosynthesis protein 2 [Coemansia sp. RSA 988]|nr:Diphthamide biosynthesis protein 2 [Coemansia sp. RSA 988]